MQNLSNEAKKINECLNEQVQTDKVHKFESNPLENEKTSSTAFRYRKFKLTENITLIVRTGKLNLILRNKFNKLK
jgi:hypothetical protein